MDIFDLDKEIEKEDQLKITYKGKNWIVTSITPKQYLETRDIHKALEGGDIKALQRYLEIIVGMTYDELIEIPISVQRKIIDRINSVMGLTKADLNRASIKKKTLKKKGS